MQGMFSHIFYESPPLELCFILSTSGDLMDAGDESLLKDGVFMNVAKQLMILALLTIAPAATAKSGEPAKVEAFYDSQRGATVEAIDQENDMLAIKNDSGNIMIMAIHPDVTSFDDVQEGDRGKIEYFDSVVVAINPAGSAGQAAPGQTYIVRNPGIKSAGTPVETFTVTATIDNITHNPDRNIDLAKLTGPNGNVYKVSIAKDVPGISKIHNGDEVTVELTPMLALDIDR
jgi:hypothetical protein